MFALKRQSYFVAFGVDKYVKNQVRQIRIQEANKTIST